MNAIISKKFELDYSVEIVWNFFNDPHRMVVCLPGATLVEEVDLSNYKGLVTFKNGPGKIKVYWIDQL